MRQWHEKSASEYQKSPFQGSLVSDRAAGGATAPSGGGGGALGRGSFRPAFFLFRRPGQGARRAFPGWAGTAEPGLRAGAGGERARGCRASGERGVGPGGEAGVWISLPRALTGGTGIAINRPASDAARTAEALRPAPSGLVLLEDLVPDTRRETGSGTEECPERQRGRTVNPLAYAFVGSSPTSSTTLPCKSLIFLQNSKTRHRHPPKHPPSPKRWLPTQGDAFGGCGPARRFSSA